MKNKEKYEREILSIALEHDVVAVTCKERTVMRCRDMENCRDCLFYESLTSSCRQSFIEWANAECEESKRFTEREKAFIRLFPEIKYIARDKWGKLFAYKDKPEKYEDREEWFNCDDPDSFYEIHFWGLEFNSIKWEDKEPTSREEILK